MGGNGTGKYITLSRGAKIEGNAKFCKQEEFGWPTGGKLRKPPASYPAKG